MFCILLCMLHYNFEYNFHRTVTSIPFRFQCSFNAIIKIFIFVFKSVSQSACLPIYFVYLSVCRTSSCFLFLHLGAYVCLRFQCVFEKKQKKYAEYYKIMEKPQNTIAVNKLKYILKYLLSNTNPAFGGSVPRRSPQRDAAHGSKRVVRMSWVLPHTSIRRAWALHRPPCRTTISAQSSLSPGCAAKQVMLSTADIGWAWWGRHFARWASTNWGTPLKLFS